MDNVDNFVDNPVFSVITGLFNVHNFLLPFSPAPGISETISGRFVQNHEIEFCISFVHFPGVYRFDHVRPVICKQQVYLSF